MTELERLARQYVAENKLTLGEKLALSVFVSKAKHVLEQRKQQGNVEEMGVVDHERGWRLTEG